MPILIQTAVRRSLSAALLQSSFVLSALAPLLSSAATQCNCACPCPCSCPQATCQNQPSPTEQNQAQQKQPSQTPPWGAPPTNGALVYNPWYAENSVPYFSAYPFTMTPYLIFDRPVPPPIPAPPPLAAR